MEIIGFCCQIPGNGRYAAIFANTARGLCIARALEQFSLRAIAPNPVPALRQ